MEALIVVDLQKDFCKNGTLEIEDADSIIPKINNLIEKFVSEGKKIVATKDWHPSTHKHFIENRTDKDVEGEYWPTHCVQYSKGAEFHSNLTNRFDKIIYKGVDENIDSYSGFFDNKGLKETELRSYLDKEKIKKIYVVGLATDYCVKYTVLDGLKLGYEVVVIKDCCKAVNLSNDDEKNAIEDMIRKGAKIINSLDI